MAGPDPTLNTLIQFNIPLPENELFTPRLACTVYDSITMGISQPTIGNFVIDVGQLMRDLEAERHRETTDLRQVVEQIRRYAMGDTIAASFRSKLLVAKEEADK